MAFAVMHLCDVNKLVHRLGEEIYTRHKTIKMEKMKFAAEFTVLLLSIPTLIIVGLIQ